MKRKITALLAAGVLLVTLAACGGKAEQIPDKPEMTPEENLPETGTTDTPNPSEEVSEAAPSRVMVFTFQDQWTVADEDGAELLAVDLQSGQVSIPDRPEAAAAINDMLEAAFSENSYVEMARYSRADCEQSGHAFQIFGRSGSLRIGRADDHVISVVFLDVEQTGGVHPNAAASAMNFDAVSGKALALADLGPDEAALRQAIGEALQDAVQAGIVSGQYYGDAAETALTMLEDGVWYLSGSGLTVICNPYEIAPHAAGIQWFTVPYGELTSLLDEKWLPEEVVDDGHIVLDFAKEGDKAPIASVNLDSEGAALSFTAEGNVQNLRLVQVYSPDGTEWYSQREYLCVNQLNDGESIQATAYLPELMPNLAVCYTQADGNDACYGVAESGKDGSVFLTPLTLVEDGEHNSIDIPSKH